MRPCLVYTVRCTMCNTIVQQYKGIKSQIMLGGSPRPANLTFAIPIHSWQYSLTSCIITLIRQYFNYTMYLPMKSKTYYFVGVFDPFVGDEDFESLGSLGGEPPDSSWMGNLFLDVLGVTLHRVYSNSIMSEVFTLHACTRGKPIGFVRLSVVASQIAISRHLSNL